MNDELELFRLERAPQSELLRAVTGVDAETESGVFRLEALVRDIDAKEAPTPKSPVREINSPESPIGETELDAARRRAEAARRELSEVYALDADQMEKAA